MLYIVASTAIYSSLRNSGKKIQLNGLYYRICLYYRTSVPSEAAFSIANFLRKERSAMSSKTLGISMAMKKCLSPLHSG